MSNPQFVGGCYADLAGGTANYEIGCVITSFGVGTFTITLNEGLDENEILPVVTLGTPSLTAEIIHTSDTVKVINLRDAAGALANGLAYVALYRAIQGNML